MTAVLLSTLDLASYVVHYGRPHLPWGMMGVGIVAWAILGGSSKSKRKGRGGLAADARKRCAGCEAEHPGFARYCKQCGRAF